MITAGKIKFLFNIFLLFILVFVGKQLISLDIDFLIENQFTFVSSFAFVLIFFFAGNSFIIRYFHNNK